MAIAATVCAAAAAGAASSEANRVSTPSSYLPLVDIGASQPLAVAEFAGVPKRGYRGLPAGPFVLRVENPYPLSLVYHITRSAGATAALLRPDPLERVGVIGPNETLRLNVRLGSPAATVAVELDVDGPQPLAVNVLGDAVLGSFAGFSPNDVNELFDAAGAGPAPLLRQIGHDAIDPLLKHEIGTTAAVARLSKLLVKLGTTRSYRKWILQHLGKNLGPLSFATLATRGAELAGRYAGLAHAGVPGQDTLTVHLRSFSTPVPGAASGHAGNVLKVSVNAAGQETASFAGVPMVRAAGGNTMAFAGDLGAAASGGQGVCTAGPEDTFGAAETSPFSSLLIIYRGHDRGCHPGEPLASISLSTASQPNSPSLWAVETDYGTVSSSGRWQSLPALFRQHAFWVVGPGLTKPSPHAFVLGPPDTENVYEMYLCSGNPSSILSFGFDSATGAIEDVSFEASAGGSDDPCHR